MADDTGPFDTGSPPADTGAPDDTGAEAGGPAWCLHGDTASSCDPAWGQVATAESAVYAQGLSCSTAGLGALGGPVLTGLLCLGIAAGLRRGGRGGGA